jgi:hypothetical protein
MRLGSMKTLFHLLVAAFFLIVPAGRCFADLMLSEIRSPKDCPESLTIKTKLTDGMIVFDVDLDVEALANAGELYKGRVRAAAFLDIATATGKIASVTLQGTGEGTRTRYHFSVSESAAKTSKLAIGVSLYQKNGKPTFGGGHSLQIHLAGF